MASKFGVPPQLDIMGMTGFCLGNNHYRRFGLLPGLSGVGWRCGSGLQILDFGGRRCYSIRHSVGFEENFEGLVCC